MTRGRVLLSIPNPAAASGGIYTDVTLRFFQFVDEMIYTGDLEFSIPGGRYLGREVVEALPGPLGGNWVEDRFQWRLAPSPATVSLTITGAVNGTVLDRIRVDMAGPEVPKLTITSIKTTGQGLSLTWAGGLPPYQVYFATNLGNAAWEPVGPVVSGNNADVTLTEPAGFFKVEGGN